MQSTAMEKLHLKIQIRRAFERACIAGGHWRDARLMKSQRENLELIRDAIRQR